MNQAEYTALSGPISNDARTLYLLGLRPSANATTGLTEPLDYKYLLNLLNSKETRFSRGRQINSLIKELVNAELIALTHDADIQLSLNGKALLLKALPVVETTSPLLPQKQPMFRDWQPNAELYKDIAQLIGIIDADYTEEERGEFLVYWLGRADAKFTDYQWSQKFAQHIKRQRTASDSATIKKTGTQTHANPVSSLEADDNAKRLVAKYKQSRKQ
jgi:hypothetical protein